MKRLVRPLTPYAAAVLREIPFAPADKPAWQIREYAVGEGREVAAAIQQLKRRGLIIQSNRTTRAGHRWQRPNTTDQARGSRAGKDA